MTLRIAWIGPWNAQSAIAAFGRFVVDELARRGHSVTVLRSETGAAIESPALPAPGQVIPVPPVAAIPVDGFDGVIANVGDHFGYHGAVIPVIEAVPCLGIVHDGLLANLASSWAMREYPGDTDALHRLVSAVYGPGLLAGGAPFWTDWAEIAATRPMSEWLARSCAGIVTHAQLWAPRMQAVCPGEVTVLPLAYPDLRIPRARRIGRHLVVATIGHANPNKRPDAVLHAIGRDPVLRERCEYRLLGPIEPAERERLGAIAASLDMPPPFASGWIDDTALRAAMAEVDVIACLRNPVLEGGSASLVTAMYSGRPTLVSDHGVYAEVPRDTVLACTPGQEADDVARHLRAILEDPKPAQARASRARAYAKETFSAARYVDGLLPAMRAATCAAPAVRAAGRLGRILGSFGVPPGDASATRLAEALRETLGERQGRR